MSPVEYSEGIYAHLADVLDALPHGFPRTPSGVELKLIKMAFTPEEVWLAGHMSRTAETAAEIANRVGRDVVDVTRILEGLAPRRLVRLDAGAAYAIPGVATEAAGEKKYRLGPFIVGWYEANMRLLDAEFAKLFEQYVVEGGGERILAPRPGLMGVIPARGSLKPELMQPYDDIDSHFQRHERFLVLDCVCKREKEVLHGHSCGQPMKRCGFVGLPPQTPLSDHVLGREEAIKLFGELEQMGHVHHGLYGFTMFTEAPQFVGCCNCCPCCCGLFAGVNHAGLSEPGGQRSNYRAVINSEECIACGECQHRCPMDAISDDEHSKSQVDRTKCIGCGVCVIGCVSEAIELQPVSEEEWFHVPASMAEWEELRLQNRLQMQ